jgi:cation diffusion facilitator CzcD-associated flavoprotein CzcO
MTENEVLVLGAGPAGLAVAGCLVTRGVPTSVLDAGAAVGDSWRQRYDRLHLHTPRIQSGLPGLRPPRSGGRWLAKDDYAAYLAGYARRHGIEPELGVVAERVDRTGDGYTVSTDAGPRQAATVVVATGYQRVPVVPAWPGTENFRGELLHSSGYRSPAPYRGKRVLVVGTGNSGAEIAADLAEQDADEVWLSCRTPPHVIRRQTGPIPTTILGIPNQYLPAGLVDPVSRQLARLTAPDLAPYGLPRPTTGLKSQFLRTSVVPLIDVGLVAQLYVGRVQVVPAVASFGAAGVVLSDGRELEVDVVVAATGYRRGLEDLVGHLGVLDADGAPRVHGARTHPDAPGLHFIGMLPTMAGMLFQINRDARATARQIGRGRGR